MTRLIPSQSVAGLLALAASIVAGSQANAQVRTPRVPQHTAPHPTHPQQHPQSNAGGGFGLTNPAVNTRVTQGQLQPSNRITIPPRLNPSVNTGVPRTQYPEYGANPSTNTSLTRNIPSNNLPQNNLASGPSALGAFVPQNNYQPQYQPQQPAYQPQYVQQQPTYQPQYVQQQPAYQPQNVQQTGYQPEYQPVAQRYQIPAGYEAYGAGTLISYGGANYVIGSDGTMSPSGAAVGGGQVASQPSGVQRYQIPAGYEGFGEGTVISYGGANYVLGSDGTMSPTSAVADLQQTAVQRYQIPAGYEGYGAGTLISYGGANYIIGSDGTMSPN